MGHQSTRTSTVTRMRKRIQGVVLHGIPGTRRSRGWVGESKGVGAERRGGIAYGRVWADWAAQMRVALLAGGICGWLMYI